MARPNRAGQDVDIAVSRALGIETEGQRLNARRQDRRHMRAEVERETPSVSLLIPPLVVRGPSAEFAALTNAGTTAAVSASWGNDTAGIIELVPGGAGIAAGSLVQVTFAVDHNDAMYIVQITPLSTAAVTLGGVSPTSRSATGWNLRTAGAPTSGSTYQWQYFVVRPVVD
jgi:hypothetical protein